MKKILALVLLLFVIFMPKVSSSQDNQRQLELLREIASLQKDVRYISTQLSTNHEEIENILQDMLQIVKMNAVKDVELSVFASIMSDMREIARGVWYNCELLGMLPIIRNAAILSYMTRQVAIIDYESGKVQSKLELIRTGNVFLQNKAALYQVDKAKDNIRALFGLYDQVRAIFQQYIERIEGKQKRKQ